MKIFAQHPILFVIAFAMGVAIPSLGQTVSPSSPSEVFNAWVSAVRADDLDATLKLSCPRSDIGASPIEQAKACKEKFPEAKKSQDSSFAASPSAEEECVSGDWAVVGYRGEHTHSFIALRRYKGRWRVPLPDSKGKTYRLLRSGSGELHAREAELVGEQKRLGVPFEVSPKHLNAPADKLVSLSDAKWERFLALAKERVATLTLRDWIQFGSAKGAFRGSSRRLEYVDIPRGGDYDWEPTGNAALIAEAEKAQGGAEELIAKKSRQDQAIEDVYGEYSKAMKDGDLAVLWSRTHLRPPLKPAQLELVIETLKFQADKNSTLPAGNVIYKRKLGDRAVVLVDHGRSPDSTLGSNFRPYYLCKEQGAWWFSTVLIDFCGEWAWNMKRLQTDVAVATLEARRGADPKGSER